MNRQKEKVSKTSKEIPGEKTVPKSKEEIDRKSASNASSRKYGAHSGIKLNPNAKKDVASQPFSFETRSKTEKGNYSSCPTRKTEMQTIGKETFYSDIDTYFLCTEVRVQSSMESLKISEESDKVENKIQSLYVGGTSKKSKIPQQSESSELRVDVVKPLHSISCLPQLSKAVRSELPKTLEDKPRSQILKESTISSIAVKTQQLLNDVRSESVNAEIPQQQQRRHDVLRIQPQRASKIRPPSVVDAQTLHGAKSKLPKFAKAPPSDVVKVQPLNDEAQASNAATDMKVPHEKYGCHAGLKLHTNVKKQTIVKPFSFDSTRKSSSSRGNGESK